MISEIIDHLDYVVIVILAVVIYRYVGRPLIHKV